MAPVCVSEGMWVSIHVCVCADPDTMEPLVTTPGYAKSFDIVSTHTHTDTHTPTPTPTHGTGVSCVSISVIRRVPCRHTHEQLSWLHLCVCVCVCVRVCAQYRRLARVNPTYTRTYQDFAGNCNQGIEAYLRGQCLFIIQSSSVGVTLSHKERERERKREGEAGRVRKYPSIWTL